MFYIVEGALQVETPDQEYHVEKGQFFITEPESSRRAFVDTDASVVGIGAPPADDAHRSEP